MKLKECKLCFSKYSRFSFKCKQHGSGTLREIDVKNPRYDSDKEAVLWTFFSSPILNRGALARKVGYRMTSISSSLILSELLSDGILDVRNRTTGNQRSVEYLLTDKGMELARKLVDERYNQLIASSVLKVPDGWVSPAVMKLVDNTDLLENASVSKLLEFTEEDTSGVADLEEGLEGLNDD